MKKIQLTILVLAISIQSNFSKASNLESVNSSGTKFGFAENNPTQFPTYSELQTSVFSKDNPFHMAQAQNEEGNVGRCLYLTAGLFVPVGFSYTINLDLPVFPNFMKKVAYNFGFNAGILREFHASEVDPYRNNFRSSAYLSLLTGEQRNGHFELGLGLGLLIEKSETMSGETQITVPQLPYIALGYRYQKPSDSFVFRIGMSAGEIFYLSLGKTI